MIWFFRCYRSTRGKDEIQAWYEMQSARVKGKFLSRLQTLASLPAAEWQLPLFRWLRGECSGLGEIRFKADVQHRPLGVRADGTVFGIVLCAIEKDSAFIPNNACEIGLNRKTEMQTDWSKSNALWLAL